MKIQIKDLQNNSGQIDGVPENPRYITDKKFDDLKKSLTRNPTFIERNPLLIYDNHGQLVVIGGNMRLKAMQSLGWKEFEHTTPILKADTPVEQIREEIIEHNTEFGSWDWDMISNEWSDLPLDDWGLDSPSEWEETDDDDTKEMTDKFDGLFGIIINCTTEQEQLDLLTQLLEDGLDCRTINAS